ncbi:MAG: hypothetical protein HQL06_03050 [Nitrospirae bacterium]|uniref:Magnetosome protein Mad2 n=1 Tax=uncultured Nitrospirota bacterium TaxID=170969 RepID=A0A142BTX2_9BACT|nr:magnetosome protein Mad2 [uncultured Nitrospirota bacterium]MBF0343185.1 hypothetical protein [Nitrospirota bacterium]
MIGVELTGYIALVVLIVANVYYPAMMIARTFFKGVSEVKAFFNKYLGLHMYLNFIGLFIVMIHGHSAEERNIVLQIAMLLTIFMAVAGFTMYQKANKMGLGRDDTLYHAKQLVFFAWFITVLIGHAIL